MALRRLLSQVKRHETQLRELSYMAAHPYRTSRHARGVVLRLSSFIGVSALGRSNYSGWPARGLRDTEGPSSASSYLRELNLLNDPEAVIRLFESQPLLHNNPSALFEYVKSLAMVDRLDQSELLKTLLGGVSGGAYSQLDEESVGKSSKDGVLGTARTLLHMVTAEGGHFEKHLWRTVCGLVLAFLLISGIGLQEDVQPTIESNTKFSDVKGLDEAKAELEKIVHYLRNPKHFTGLDGKLPKGVLLVGPPGTGKTMLARAIAGEAGVPFFSCSGTEFKEMSLGVVARRVIDLFSAANRRSPCVIFMDNIDAIGSSRMKMTLVKLLVKLFGFYGNEGIFVIAATNFPDYKELVRPGLLFDRRIDVPNPNVEGRRQILEVHMSKVLKAEDVDLMIIARGTLGFSGTDLANLIKDAALKAKMDGSLAVSMADLEHAKEKIMMGCEYKSLVKSPKTRKMIAYHEAGHALVAIHTDGAFPVRKVTIVPDRLFLGMVSLLTEVDETAIPPRFHVSRKERLIAKIDILWKAVPAMLDVSVSGKVAEELIFGESIPNGSNSDLQNAMKLAILMVAVSRVMGFLTHNYDDNGKSIEEEVQELLERANNNAKTILTTHIKELRALANALLVHETLSGSQIKDMLAQMNSDEQPSLQTQERIVAVQSSSQSY